jgi:transaldolase
MPSHPPPHAAQSDGATHAMGHPKSDHTRPLHELGQRLWLDDFSPALLHSGALQRDIREFAISGVTANPRCFEQAIGSGAFDQRIRVGHASAWAGEELFYELLMDDLTQAADLLRPAFEASDGCDGWVSIEVSPLLADNTAHTIQAAHRLFDRAARSNCFIKLAGTPEGLRALEELIFDGVPVNVSLLFAREQYMAAAEAYLRGIERRLAAKLDPKVASVASMSVNSWDAGVQDEISAPFHNRLGIAMAARTYRSYCELLATDRWQQLAAAGARPQRLAWVDTATHDRGAPDTLYVQALVSPDTIVTMNEQTLLAFADHGLIGSVMPPDGGYADAVLEEFRREGVDDEALALRLQRQGVDAGANTWHAMLTLIRQKSEPDPSTQP